MMKLERKRRAILHGFLGNTENLSHALKMKEKRMTKAVRRLSYKFMLEMTVACKVDVWGGWNKLEGVERQFRVEIENTV